MTTVLPPEVEEQHATGAAAVAGLRRHRCAAAGGGAESLPLPAVTELLIAAGGDFADLEINGFAVLYSYRQTEDVVVLPSDDAELD